MRVLLLGANGFIGRELLAVLAARGHEVVAATRHAPPVVPFGARSVAKIDLNHATSPEQWLPALSGCEAVVNCAGILQRSRGQSIEAIHTAAPIALFRACEQAGVRRVVQVSAISAERAAGTAYALTKLAADDALRASRLEWVVLRPSLVVARGAYGGTALLRAMASFPFVIPVPGSGLQAFQPIHVDDLAAVVVQSLETEALLRTTVDPVGPETVNLRRILGDYRRWLGMPAAPIAEMPRWVVRLATRAGDLVGGPLNSTAAAQLEQGNAGDFASFARATGSNAKGWSEILAAGPAHAQDRWHARLYFVRPLLRASLAILWAGSAVAGALAIAEWTPRLAAALSLHPSAAATILGLACLADAAIAVLVARRWRPGTMALVQSMTILAYSGVASILWPALWADPLGTLLKNLPILAAVLALGATEEGR